MTFKEIDKSLRDAFSLSTLTLLSGFIGVSAADGADNWAAAGNVGALILSVSFLYRTLLDDEDRTFQWWFLVIILGFASWLFASLITAKPFMMGGIFGAWVVFSAIFQAGKIGRQMDVSFQNIEGSISKIESQIDAMVESNLNNQSSEKALKRSTKPTKNRKSGKQK